MVFMKIKYKIALLICFLIADNSGILISQSIKPEPGTGTKFTFPDFKEVKFDNGFRMYLLPDKRQPFIALRLLVKIGGDAKSVNSLKSKIISGYLAGALQSKSIEGPERITGAVFSSESNNEYLVINCLSHSRYSGEITRLLLNSIINTTPNRKAIEGILKNVRNSAGEEISNPEMLADAMAGRIFRGIRETPGSVAEELNAVNSADIEEFFKVHFIPRNVTLSVVGDFGDSLYTETVKASVKVWKPGKEQKEQEIQLERLPVGIYFIPRQESVQSFIMFATDAVNAASQDYERLNVLTDIAGSRIYGELRENMNIAYSAKGYITSYSKGNNVAFITAVSTANTIAAIKAVKDLLAKMAETDIEPSEIKKYVDYAVNRFYMSYDRKEVIANFIQDCIFYGLPKESIKNYAEYLKSIKPYDINQLAKKYLSPGNMYIIVVGNPEIKSSLEKIGEVFEYGKDLYSANGADSKLEKMSITPDELIEKYIDAIGGIEKLRTINTVFDSATVIMTVGGTNFTGYNLVYRQVPDKYYSYLDCGALNLRMYSDGQRIWMRNNSFTEEFNPDDRQKLYTSTKLFAITKLSELGYKCRILGKSNGMVLMEALSNKGSRSIYYFSDDDYLLKKIETVEPEPNPSKITEIQHEYKEFGGLLLPVVTETITPVYNLKAVHNYFINIQFGQGIEFTPPRD